MAQSHRPTTGKPAKGRKPSREFRSIQNTPLSRMLDAITRTAATTLDTRTWNDCPTTGIVPASSNLGIPIDCSMHTFTPCEIAWQALSWIEHHLLQSLQLLTICRCLPRGYDYIHIPTRMQGRFISNSSSTSGTAPRRSLTVGDSRRAHASGHTVVPHKQSCFWGGSLFTIEIWRLP
jgi:hypothetical protein